MSGLLNDLWDLIFHPKKPKKLSLITLLWLAILINTIVSIITYPFRKIKEIFTGKSDPVDDINPHSDKLKEEV